MNKGGIMCTSPKDPFGEAHAPAAQNIGAME